MRADRNETFTHNPNPNLAIPETPSRTYKYNCVICQDEFETNYRQQRFCRNPCKSGQTKSDRPPKQEPKVVRTKSQISQDNLKKLRAREEKARQFTLLQRKMFSKRL